jgi:hypothetical protein
MQERSLTSFANTTLSISTREIAELRGKGHGNVLADFCDMCEALEITELSFQSSYLDSTGRTLPVYVLPKDLTTTLVSGYSIPMRHASWTYGSHVWCDAMIEDILKGNAEPS